MISRRSAPSPRPIPVGVPAPVAVLAAILHARLPGVGERTAYRFAISLAMGDGLAALDLGRVIAELPSVVGQCWRCGALAERLTDGAAPICAICSDRKRDADLLCIVWRQQDLLAIESSGAMRGRYFILGKLLSPLEGVGMDALPMARLRSVLADGVEEVALALPATVDGDATSMVLARQIARWSVWAEGDEEEAIRPVRATRIAHGVASGVDIEHANPVTIAAAIQGRGVVAG